MPPLRPILAGFAILSAAGVSLAQFFRDEPGGASYSRLEGGGVVNEDTVRTARETLSHSITLPSWTNTPGFEQDVFTFARIIFKSRPDLSQGIGRGRRLGWWVDYPDADLNLSYRLRQMTSIAVDPDARTLKLTNPDLFKFPLIFMEHIEGIMLNEEETEILRRYLLSGGSMLITDFWGTEAWEHFRREMKTVLPEHDWIELTTDHPLFRSIFPLEVPMHKLRVPTMQFWNPNSDPDDPLSELQYQDRGYGSLDMKIWAMLDDHQRIMAIAVHNSDISDGWERESENETYFKQFSESRAYPLTMNILFHLMTH
ncbi:DUF4159 domain-containing protein [Opitutaceae bacterium]